MQLKAKLVCFDWAGLDLWPSLLAPLTSFQVGEGALSWTNKGAMLHVFERI